MLRGSGGHYVVSLPGNVLRYYRVTCYAGGLIQGVDDDDDQARKPGAAAPGRSAGLLSTCTGPTVTEQPVEPATLEAFQIVRQIWLDTDGTFVKSLDVPYAQTGLNWVHPTQPMRVPDAYEVTGNVNFRGQLAYALANHGPRTMFQYLESLVNYVAAMINAFAGQTDGLRIVIRVVFSDGSAVTYQFNYGDSHAQYQPGSATTPTGQAIPDVPNSAGGVGTWSQNGALGGTEDLQRLLDYFANHGVTIVRGGDEPRSVTCTWDGVNLVCVVR